MREMKDSGVAWIATIPIDWILKRGKFVFKQRSEKGNQFNLELLSPTQKFGVIPQSKYEELTGMAPVKLKENTDLSQLKTIHKGDYCISLRSFQGGFEYSEYEGVVSPAYQVFHPIVEICDDYYKHLFKMKPFIDKMNSYTLTLRDGKTIAFSDFANTLIPIPSLKEQYIIAEHLDRILNNVDKLISNHELQTEKLKAYKQSLISEVVTKGLNPDAPMKDSGVEWIGEIPSKWDVFPLKTSFEFGKGLPITKADLTPTGIKVISYGQIHAKYNSTVTINDKLYRFVNDSYLETNPLSLVHNNDMIFADTSEDVEGAGNFVFIDNDETIFAGYHTVVLKSLLNKDNKYLAFLFMSNLWKKQIQSLVKGIKVYSITRSILSNATFILPPEDEQEQIVDYLEKRCLAIDRLIEIKKQKIEKLNEYKKSLIYEYVTGKKEV